ncbi:MAG TPA: c-type cytochrome [Gammaproteobacteria bacterium]|nr:c-type cytochrome [Gammaproteobacteria bacterium]
MYNARCYFCHGYNGDARTVAARYLDPPPRAFTATDPKSLSTARMVAAVTHGRSGTAMKSFAKLLSKKEIRAVVAYVRSTFMARRAANTAYHTPENGWPDHQRYRAAFPFALGEVPVDTPADGLTPGQREGLRLFRSGCVTCHEGSRRASPEAVFDLRAVSYPRGGFRPGKASPDAVSGASPYARHEVAPLLVDATPEERRGEALFQDNCAFCHAADGTGRNWIGRFLEPHPRDLTDPRAMAAMTPARLRRVIREGLPGTTMPAWGGVLQPAEIDALVRYIDRAFHPLARGGNGSRFPEAARPRIMWRQEGNGANHD